MCDRLLLLALVLACSAGGQLRAQGSSAPPTGSATKAVVARSAEMVHGFRNRLDYGPKGVEYASPYTDTELWFGLRFQLRYNSFEGDLASIEDVLAGGDSKFGLRRGRIKGGGAIWRDWVDGYAEYDFASNTLLDYRITVTCTSWLSIRLGQWKSEFNRERIDSSGRQQLVERSISNYWFTVDRQRAFAILSRLAEGSFVDTSIWVEALSGQGLGSGFEDNSRLWLGRLQWNPAGEELRFSQSDLVRRETPLPSFAVATIIGRTPFTRFSSSGGGELPGFEVGDYDLSQLLFETAVHYRGLAWQQELHWKTLDDRDSGQVTRLVGGYAQLGSFLNEWWPSVPPQLELAGRVAIIDPDRSVAENLEWEWTVGANWFIHGHRNKLTTDLSWIEFESPLRDASQWRFRVQWELSI